MKQKESLIELLNVLLEAERAGVATVNHLIHVPSNERDELMKQYEQVRKDEAWSCAGLHESIIREGGIPSKRVGDFIHKVEALDRLEEKLILLNKGQSWVAHKVDEALAYDLQPETEAFLKEMKAKHETNIDEFDQYLQLRE